MSESLERVYRYHDGTKHQFGRYARSLGYLDWASQPRPFRGFAGAPVVALHPGSDVREPPVVFPRVTYDRLFAESPAVAAPLTAEAIGDFLRHALGLSAWKVFQRSRWSLRVNPSSGNLHPTEAYLVTGAIGGLADSPSVWHYAPDRHALEQRCAFAAEPWPPACARGSAVVPAGSSAMICAGGAPPAFFVALTSIHWREAWKYGERAFRYCQHDMGHAIAAISLSAALHGWSARMVPACSHRDIATLVGIDRDEDYFEAEREEPGCLLLVTGASSADLEQGAERPGSDARERLMAQSGGRDAWGPDAGLLGAVRSGRWSGKASQLSEDHVEWTVIDEVAKATADGGRAADVVPAFRPASGGFAVDTRGLDARRIMLQRRSAVALDGMSAIDRARFFHMLARVAPGPSRAGAPWDALWWAPCIHLALFVHRVIGLESGLYLLARSADAAPRLKAACDRNFRWELVDDGLQLWLLQPGDFGMRSKRVSCDQDIAADGFFSLGMIAEFDASLSGHGASFYRHLFWESGAVGQVLYLEAEAAGARATGIGCFFDDAVHELLGIEGHAFQSLYHFTVGRPVEDARLTTEPGYVWEQP